MPGEFDLINRVFLREIEDSDVILGIGDDAAVLALSSPVLIATDTLVSGVHFPADTPPAAIGHKALAVNLSDIAAMGAVSRFATLALTVPNMDEPWLDEFANGWFALASRYGVRLIGGDTTQGPLSITVSVLGELADERQALRRSGAQAGDRIFVTGTLGDARAGLEISLDAAVPVDAGRNRHLVERLNRPEPRVRLGLAISDIASAAIDLSDGLCADLQHILAASSVGARIDTDLLPLSAELIDYAGPSRARDLALAGGDDFELLFCVPPAKLEKLAQLGDCDTACTQIGEITDSGTLVLEDAGVRLDPGAYRGYEHFS